jgi:hypothetical protein
MSSSTTAKATVVSARQTGNRGEQAGSMSFEVAVQLRVEPDVGAPFVATATQYVSVMDLAGVQPGASGVVHHDPSDMTQVAIANVGGSTSAASRGSRQDVERARQLTMETEALRNELGARDVGASARVLESRKIELSQSLGALSYSVPGSSAATHLQTSRPRQTMPGPPCLGNRCDAAEAGTCLPHGIQMTGSSKRKPPALRMAPPSATGSSAATVRGGRPQRAPNRLPEPTWPALMSRFSAGRRRLRSADGGVA